MRLRILLVAVATTACTHHTSKRPEASGGTSAPAKAAIKDSVRAASRRGIPSGFVGTTDDGKSAEGANYRNNSGRWEITTGPAHIMYAPGDTTSLVFTVATTFDQLEAPEHPDGFGLFIGGTDLGTPTMRYTYFAVRGSGEFLVRVRDGVETRDIVGWTANPAILKQNADGWGRYRLAIQVRHDSVRFLVSGKPVAAVKADVVPTKGVAGLRIHRNLRINADHLRMSS